MDTSPPNRHLPSADGEASIRKRGQATYVCECCGESFIVGIEPSAGTQHDFTGPCPACCNQMRLHVEIPPDASDVGDDVTPESADDRDPRHEDDSSPA